MCFPNGRILPFLPDFSHRLFSPFNLAADVIINDTWDWEFGPEYTYDVNMTYNVKEDNLGNAPMTGCLNSMVKCRPKDREILLCRLHNVTSVAYLANGHVDTLETEKTFAIKFNESGVESLMIEPPFSVGIANVIGKIVNQFSVNVNQIRDSIYGRPIPDITRMEKTPMGKCTTTYRIKHGESQSKGFRDTNFRLEVLPIPSVKSNTDLSINKIRKRCTGSADLFDFLKNFPNEKIFEMVHFYGASLRPDSSLRNERN